MKNLFTSVILLLLSLQVNASNKKEFVIPFGTDWPPFSYLNKQNELIGSDIELLKNTLNRIGYSLNHLKGVPVKRLVNHNKNLPLNANMATNYTKERALKYHFSNFYRKEKVAVLYVDNKFKELSSIEEFLELAETISINTSANYGDKFEILRQKYQHKFYHSETAFRRLKQLATHRVDIVISDMDNTNILMESPEFKEVEMSSIIVAENDVSFVFLKSEFDEEFLSKFNNALDLELKLRQQNNVIK